jgi:hypothetical protein
MMKNMNKARRHPENRKEKMEKGTVSTDHHRHGLPLMR